MRTLKQHLRHQGLAVLAMMVFLAAAVAQAPAADSLRLRVEQAISTFEPLPDAAEFWAGMPADCLDHLVGFASDTAAPAHLRAGALHALGFLDADLAERYLRTVALDPEEDALRVVAARALAQLGTHAPARAADVLLALRASLDADADGRNAAIEALPVLSDPAALELLDQLASRSEDPMQTFSLHRARAKWLSSFGGPSPAVSLVVEQGEQLAESVRLQTQTGMQGAELAGYRVRLLPSRMAPPASVPSGSQKLVSGLTWQLQRLPEARNFWVGVEILHRDAAGDERVAGVTVLHVFRIIHR